MTKWTLKQKPKMVPVLIDSNIYQEHLAEIARILYRGFCQLDPRFKPSTFPLKAHALAFGQNHKGGL